MIYGLQNKKKTDSLARELKASLDVTFTNKSTPFHDIEQHPETMYSLFLCLFNDWNWKVFFKLKSRRKIRILTRSQNSFPS